MRAEVTDQDLVIVAENAVEERALRKAFQAGHLHFVCKGRIKNRLYLTRSVMAWKPVKPGDRSKERRPARPKVR